MRNILFVASLLIFVGCVVSQYPIGNQIFYANVLMTNAIYGTGAAFPNDVWFNGNLGVMRVDYKNPTTNAVFMSVFYNYTSHDKYEVCNGQTCARATWNAPMPIFYGTSSSYAKAASCVTPDYPGPRACVSNCNTYVANPAQPQGIWSLSYNDTSTALCLVRWSVPSGQQYGPEWHVRNYYTSSFPNGVPSPSSASTYSSVISGVTCPQPTCYTVLDLAIIVDESGSICNPNDASKPCYWPNVQDFVLGLISTFNMAPDRVRVGLAYFSGLGDCRYNWTGTSSYYSSSCSKANSDGTCPNCGGRWDTITNGGLTTDKTGLYKQAYDHAIQAGYTCISCGLDIGIKLLNIAPKANVQKLIILFTDGAQNMVTNTLKYEGDLAKSMGINVIAVATGGYKLSDLQVFTNNIYTANTYSGLSSLINNITAPLCQPLANIDTCDFCSSGLCSCATTCNCPNCNDYNACTNERCDIRAPPDGTLGGCVYTNVTCNDNNVCTVDNCNPATGCDFSTPTPAPTGPQTNTYCNRYNCSNPAGYTYTDFGTGLCPQGTNLCLKTYCNSTVGTTAGLAGSCMTLDSSQIPYGTTISYTTSAGLAGTAIGCKKPSSAIPCAIYSCSSVDGKCYIDYSKCKCQFDSDCNDQDGCTTDVCDTNLNQCNNTRRDCWSDLSNGVCKQGLTGSANTTTGDLYWSTGSGPFPLTNGLPNTGSYACDRLACYGGKRSTYTCQSLSATTSQCVRATVDCTSSGCVDGVCKSLGTWTNGQYNTDCSNTKTRTCDDGSKCTTDSCKSTYTGTACTQASCPTDSTRCNFVGITCDDNNACTQNLCNNSTGCDFSQPTPTPSPNTCYNFACDSQKGIVKTVNPTACQNANLCLTSYCNTTSLSCVTWDKSQYFTNNFTTFVDQNGFLQTYYGCKNTSALALSCLSTKCNQATGACYIDTSSCACTKSTDCNDNNGCTTDTCTVSGTCTYAPVDCWNTMSNGGCSIGGGPGTADTTVGMNNYNQGSPNNPFVQPTGTSKIDCPTMGCFSGKRSQYVCTSTGDYTSSCSRVTTDCSKGGCLDTTCGTLGTWTNNQYDTNCVTAYVPNCASNACYAKSCNTNFVYQQAAPGQTNGNTPNLGEYRCIVAYNGTSCVDGNLCTVDQICQNSTGCDFSQQTADPLTPNNCFLDTCGSSTGWTRANNGAGFCPPQADLCQINYCNTSLAGTNGNAGACAIINRRTFPVGQTQYYTDSDGLTKAVTGCSNPNANDFACRKFDCDQTTGLCTVNIDSCQCLKDSDCYDGTGCTIDKCVATGLCQRTYIDCYSYFSNGTCIQGTTQLSYDNSTGLALYNEYLNNQYSNSPVYSQVDSNGNPSPATTVSRTCAQLSCYNGAPSTYSCSSSAEGSYTCSRSFLNCSRNGCQDNVCQSLGTWNANNQSDSNCGLVITPNCADNNACTSDYCDIAWTPTSKTPRCRHDSLNGTNFCDDGNFCTEDYCDQQDTSGNVCKHRLYADWYVRKYICKKAKVCQTVQCTVNRCIYGYIGCTAPTLCVFFTCNGSTNGTCKAYPTGAYKIDSCGVCGGNGLSCVPTKPGNPKKTSIAVALGVGLGIGLLFAAIIIGIISQRSYAAYLALGTETLGTVTTSPTYQGAEHHLDTGDYHRGSK